MNRSSDADPLPEDVSCDVLVVGYGPVGMTCAALLAHYGLDVVAIEHHQNFYGLPRAGHLDSETMRIFQRLGIAESIELVSQVVRGLQVVTPEWEVLGSVELGQPGEYGWRSDQLAYQPDLEDIISARGEKLGVRRFMATTAEAIRQDDDGVSTVVRPRGEPERQPSTIRSRYVIGADGAGSFVRGAIGAERRDLGFKAMPHLVVDFEYHDQDQDIPELQHAYFVVDPERPHDVGRYGGRRNSRLEFAAKPDETREYLEQEEIVWRLLAPWGMSPEKGRIIRSAVYDFESSLAEPWRVGRVFLAGDAAHTMPPFMGQGMLAGVRDAENLAWKLAAVTAGDATDSILNTYETERAPHAKAITEASMAVASMALVTDPEQVRARDDMLRAGTMPQPQFPRLGHGILRPPGSSGVEGRPGPQTRVAAGTRIDLLDNHFDNDVSWRLAFRHTIPDGLFTARQQRLLDSLNMQYAHIHRGMTDDDAYLWDIDAAYDDWYRSTGVKAYIERPDRYIFGAVKTTDELPALVDELAEVLAANGWVVAQEIVSKP
ncbi:MAG: bifunctional 3-(3-hydroxy-phenyl)propionate/3-hydroxycinnamic acid hydroxylase [Nocardioidaceae bacterium]